MFHNGFYVLSPLCILYSDYFSFNNQSFKGHREKLKCLPFKMLVAWVLFPFVFFIFHPTYHIDWRPTDFPRNEDPLLTYQHRGSTRRPIFNNVGSWLLIQGNFKIAISIQTQESLIGDFFPKICVEVWPFFPKLTEGEDRKRHPEVGRWWISSSPVSFFIVLWKTVWLSGTKEGWSPPGSAEDETTQIMEVSLDSDPPILPTKNLESWRLEK